MKDTIKRSLRICKGCEKYHEHSDVYLVDANGHVVRDDRKGTPPFHECNVTLRFCDCEYKVVNAQTRWSKFPLPDNCLCLMEHKMKEWNKC